MWLSWVQRGSGSQSTILLAAGSFEGRLSGSFHDDTKTLQETVD